MSNSQFLDDLRARHHDCCLVDECQDEGCELVPDGLDPKQLVIIGGTNYQAQLRFTARLCDFVCFGGDGQRFICAAEFKGGGNVEMQRTVDQIQNGLNVADNNVGEHTVDSWFPLLLHGTQILPWRMDRFLLANQVEFRGERKRIQAKPCGSQLKPIVRPE